MFPLTCKATINKTLDDSIKITTSLVEQEQGNARYCLCSLDGSSSRTLLEKIPVSFICVVMETTIGSNT